MNFDERVARRFSAMSPAEQRVAHFFRQNREEVLIASAAAIAAKVKTSDATIVRTARGLGYAGLDALRRSLAAEMRQSLSPADRLSRTLDAVGEGAAAAFQATIATHLHCLQSLASSVMPGQFGTTVDALVTARRVVAFGIGPTSAMVDYLAIQLGRFGIEALTLTNTGLLFADDLRKLRDGDVVIIFAYSRVYAEVAALLESTAAMKLRCFLVTDTLGDALKRRVDMVLTVPRGRSDMLSMHTATLGFIEALLVGIAAKRPQETLGSLKKLNQARTKLAGNAVQLHAKN